MYANFNLDYITTHDIMRANGKDVTFNRSPQYHTLMLVVGFGEKPEVAPLTLAEVDQFKQYLESTLNVRIQERSVEQWRDAGFAYKAWRQTHATYTQICSLVRSNEEMEKLQEERAHEVWHHSDVTAAIQNGKLKSVHLSTDKGNLGQMPRPGNRMNLALVHPKYHPPPAFALRPFFAK